MLQARQKAEAAAEAKERAALYGLGEAAVGRGVARPGEKYYQTQIGQLFRPATAAEMARTSPRAINSIEHHRRNPAQRIADSLKMLAARSRDPYVLPEDQLAMNRFLSLAERAEELLRAHFDQREIQEQKLKSIIAEMDLIAMQASPKMKERVQEARTKAEAGAVIPEGDEALVEGGPPGGW
jgi:phytoene dehydrogenase-like protein